MYKKENVICDLWPLLKFPYLESILTPRKKELYIKKKKQILTILENNKGEIIEKTIISKKKIVSIFYSIINTNVLYQPIFSFGLLKKVIKFEGYLKSKIQCCIVNITNEKIFAEFIYETLHSLLPGIKVLDEIILTFANFKYKISSQIPFKCAFNYNIITIQFENYKRNNNKILFPTLRIFRIS